MNKRPDFGTDLETLNDSVTAEVGDVLQVLKQKRTARSSVAASEAEEPEKIPLEKAAREEGAPKETAAPQRHMHRQRPARRSRLVPTINRDEPLENVTTRLRQRTNERLTEAALRQRLKKESPATRQEIVEAALGDWFRKHGYMRGPSEDDQGDDTTIE